MAPRNRLNLEKKLMILDECDKGVPVKTISAKFGVPKSSVCTIKKMKPKIMKFVEQQHQTKLKRSLKKSEFPKMEQHLFKWFIAQRKNHIPVSGTILKSKAKELHAKFYSGTFYASDGWMTKFKKRFGVRLLKESGEKLSSNAECVEPFKKELDTLIQQNKLSEDAVFNADESGLYWKLLPDKTYVHPDEVSAPGRKQTKERFTFLACANASGTKKMKLLVIGKSKNTRPFKNKMLPVDYMHSKSAWMNSFIFKKWFYDYFVPQVSEFLEARNLPKKALLILDNAPSHPPENELIQSTEDGLIWVKYMPPNVTPLIQPMDQNAIRLTKLNYKNSLLNKLIATGTDNLSASLKKVDIFEAVSLLSLSWQKVTESSIKKCWRNILSKTLNFDEQFDEEDEMPLSELMKQDDMNALKTMINLVEAAFPNCGLTVSDVHEWNNTNPCEDSDESDSEDMDQDEAQNESQNFVKHDYAVTCLEKLVEWGLQNNIECSKVLMLRELQQFAVQKQLETVRKQTLINDFFTTL